MIEYIMNLDGNILLWAQENIRTIFLTPIFIFITKLGNSGQIWAFISVILLIPKKTRKVGIICLVSLIFSVIINNEILKNLVGRLRPFDSIDSIIPLIQKPTDFSFPSGHTSSSFACAGVMFSKLPKKFGVPALVLASLIGISRIYLGVHYPSDVLMGILVGIFISWISIFAVDFLVNIKTKNYETD